MKIKEEIKKTAVTEPIKIVLQWLSPLIGTLILAAIPQVRDRIWPATPKLLLLVLLVISLSVILWLLPSLSRLRKHIRHAELDAEDARSQTPKLQERVSELNSDLEKLKIEHRALQNEYKDLSYQLEFDETIDKILLILSEGSAYPATVANKLEFHRTRAEYFLTELEKHKYVKQAGTSAYTLTQMGKGYLIKKGLV